MGASRRLRHGLTGHPIHQAITPLPGLLEGIQRAWLALADQHVRPLAGLQPGLQAPAGRHRPQPQHLQVCEGHTGGQRQLVGQQEIPTTHLSRQIGRHRRQGIHQHGPATAELPLAQSLFERWPLIGQTAPWACHHHPWARRVKASLGQQGRSLEVRAQRQNALRLALVAQSLLLPRDPERLLLRPRGMEWLLKRQIAMHRPGLTMGATPGLLRQRLELFRGCGIQALIRTAHQPTAHRVQKLLLIHGLIRTALLEPRWSIGGKQQQGLTGAIGLHGSRQKVRHSSA